MSRLSEHLLSRFLKYAIFFWIVLGLILRKINSDFLLSIFYWKCKNFVKPQKKAMLSLVYHDPLDDHSRPEKLAAN